MAKRGRPAGKRKGGRTQEEIKAQINAREEAAKKRKEERGLTGAAADSSKQFKTREKYEAVQRARKNSLNPENKEEFQEKIDNLPKIDDLPDLDELLKSVRSEGKKEKKKGKKISAIIPSPKAEKKKTESIADENIDPVILRLLGLEDVFDIDYDTYKTLLREKMAAGRMSGSKMPTEEVQKVTEEFKRIKSKTGRFKVKGQKVKASTFVAKKKPSGTPTPTAGYLPGRGGALVKTSDMSQPGDTELGEEAKDGTKRKTKKALNPVAEIIKKINQVDKNIKRAIKVLEKGAKDKKKKQSQDRKAADLAAKQAKESAAERKSKRKSAASAMKKALKPIGDLFGGILDFFKKIAFATVVMELLRFLKDPAAYFQGIIDWGNSLIERFNDWTKGFIEEQTKKINDALKPLNKKILGAVQELNKVLEKLGFLGIEPIEEPDPIEVKPEPIIESTRIPLIPPEANPFGQPKKNEGPSVSRPSKKNEGPSVSTPLSSAMPMGKTGSATKALLDTIAFAEGTYGESNSGYNTHFGFSQTEDLSKHPNKVIRSGGYASAAFGRYQFMPDTWKGVMGGAMTPERQDQGAIKLVMRRLNEAGIKVSSAAELEKLLQKEGMSQRITDALAPEWASFPTLNGTSFYGQPKKDYETLNKFFTNRSPSPTKAGDLSMTPAKPIAAAPEAPSPAAPMLAMATGGGSALPTTPSSTANANQKDVAAFSAMNSGNPTTLAIKSIYSVVG